MLLYTSTISEWGLGTLLTREVAKERGSVEAVREDFRQTLALRLLISVALFVPVGLFILLYTNLFDLGAGGAWAVVVGSAITRPVTIARRFSAALENRGEPEHDLRS